MNNFYLHGARHLVDVAPRRVSQLLFYIQVRKNSKNFFKKTDQVWRKNVSKNFIRVRLSVRTKVVKIYTKKISPFWNLSKSQNLFKKVDQIWWKSSVKVCFFSRNCSFFSSKIFHKRQGNKVIFRQMLEKNL